MSTSTHFVFFADHRPWLNVSLRSVMALFGGYGLASMVAATLAVGLPLPRPDAVMTAIMLAFLVHMLAALWVFGAATLTRAAAGLAMPAALLGLWLWLLPVGATA
ncbi:hypothetical protein GPA19_01540 [Azoarcus indigens]|uniref:DUF3649 domain-containing protein n=1 Tax=Azoarcus indigens TaxID=29545 RepID=A0A4R6EF98_9RHOO|nr:hypothetical protein [Azoarcus indigens]NMG63635.1 hypothetical protein [Azoarcus indigens]TDN56169.1 hypothetical protein C7389_102104 [Azoarcus indigens]